MSDLVGNPEDRFSHNEAQLCDPVQDVETIRSLCQLLTASGNLFRNMCDAWNTTDYRSLLTYK